MYLAHLIFIFGLINTDSYISVNFAALIGGYFFSNIVSLATIYVKITNRISVLETKIDLHLKKEV